MTRMDATRRRWIAGAFGGGIAALAGPVWAADASLPDGVFRGRAKVTVTELIDALGEVATEMESATAVRDDYDAFVESQGLHHTPELFSDYVRVKLAFETTRDGGLWRMRWRITNRKPNSEEIWSQWGRLRDPDKLTESVPSAEAECDELSALFAFFVRRLGVDRVGLMWPVWNHVVAVWTVEQDEQETRIVVPTSQIFLGPDESLGTDGFNPRKQKTIFTYKRRDVRMTHRIPGALAEFFVQEARFAVLPQSELQALRNARSAALDGS